MSVFQKYKPVVMVSFISLTIAFLGMLISYYDNLKFHIDLISVIILIPTLAYIAIVLLDYLQGAVPSTQRYIITATSKENKSIAFQGDAHEQSIKNGENDNRNNRIESDTVNEIISNNFCNITNRLKDEIYKLVQRGNLNLVLGIVTTIAGIVALTLVILKYQNSVNDITLILAYFIPRLSLVILIEMFSYFFLHLYKNTLVDIKYFQNEITNVEAWFTSLQISVCYDNKVDRSKILSMLSAMERNFTIKKGETTIQNNKNKTHLDLFKETSNMIQALVKTVGKGG